VGMALGTIRSRREAAAKIWLCGDARRIDVGI
jgi:hypothetical protein